MEAQHFDALTRTLCEVGSRRGVLGLLATLPVLGGLFALLDPNDADAKGRRRRRKKAHKHGKGRRRKHHRKKCKAQSTAKTCAGTCGPVKNNCKKTVDCGPCACDPPCPACQICNVVTATCVPDPDQLGEPCGEPGQICLNDGACACTTFDPATCPACTSCGGDGTCQGCSGCCDGETCVPDCGECRVCDDGQCVSCPDCCDNGTCVANCPSCQACDGGQCRSCEALGQLCCADTCVSGECCSNAQCSGITPICNGAHACVACETNAECGEGFLCLQDGACQACSVSCSDTPEECGAA
jgi:hypothetical protein